MTTPDSTTPDPPGPADHTPADHTPADQTPATYQLRVSTQERERVAAYLSEALSGGRLTPTEFAERSQAAYAATIYADLTPLLADLIPDPSVIIAPPNGPTQNQTQSGALQQYPRSAVANPGQTQVQSYIGPNGLDTRIGGSAGGATTSFAVVSDIVRSGEWTVPPKYYTFAQFGDSQLDLRQARFVERSTTIWCYAIFGDVEIIVPPDITIHVSGFGVFGTVGGLSQIGPPGCPEITISGYTIFGDVTARLRTKKEQRQLRKQERRQRRGLRN